MEVQTLKYPAIRNYVAGQLVASAATPTMDVFSPLSGQLISTLPLSNAAGLDAAIVNPAHIRPYAEISEQELEDAVGVLGVVQAGPEVQAPADGPTGGVVAAQLERAAGGGGNGFGRISARAQSPTRHPAPIR